MHGLRMWLPLIVLLLAAGCQTTGPGPESPGAPAERPLTDITWEVAAIDGDPVTPPQGERKIHLKFDVSRKRAAGFNGCNNFFGAYTLDGEQLSFGMMGSTMMACTEDPDIERRMMEALGTIDRYGRNGDTLILFQGSQERVVLHAGAGD